MSGPLFIVSVVVPIIALLFCAYDSLVTRYVARHVVAADDAVDVTPGTIVAVSGAIRATPVGVSGVRMPESGALMVWRLNEARGSKTWRRTSQAHWISRDATIGPWRLDREAIKHAAFEQYRASPCVDYAPEAGWWADCDKGYAYSAQNNRRRYSYMITPRLDAPVTIIAMVAPGGALGPIEHRLSAPPANLVIWGYGEKSPQQLLAERLHREVGWIAICAGISLISLWARMYAALRRRSRGVFASIGGGFWRAALTLAPLAPIAWPFDGRGYIAVAFLGLLLTFAVGLVLWFIAMPDDLGVSEQVT